MLKRWQTAGQFDESHPVFSCVGWIKTLLWFKFDQKNMHAPSKRVSKCYLSQKLIVWLFKFLIKLCNDSEVYNQASWASLTHICTILTSFSTLQLYLLPQESCDGHWAAWRRHELHLCRLNLLVDMVLTQPRWTTLLTLGPTVPLLTRWGGGDGDVTTPTFSSPVCDDGVGTPSKADEEIKVLSLRMRVLPFQQRLWPVK